MASGSHRLGTGGRIDRSRAIAFTLEGRRLQGFGGDTLASALLAQGVSLLGRSFKYHRPRGLLAAGVEEPNGLVTLGEGGGRTPNVPVTTVELHEGIVACRQNGWPSVEVDVMAALTACATPLLGAGFYYKTFMGPRRGSWMLYEPYIRRAAGLGQGTHTPDPDRYETRHAFTDVLVIGAGPAGLAAACAAAAAGARVMLIEQDFALGGSLLSVLEPTHRSSRGASRSRRSCAPCRISRSGCAPPRSASTTATRSHCSSATIMHGPTRAAASRAKWLSHCARAPSSTRAAPTERPLVFADNDRPGVMLSSAVRTYLNRYAVAAGRRAVLATNNDSAYATALDLAAAGVPVTVLDERARPGAGMVEAMRGAGVEVRSAVRVARALGGRALKAVEFEALEGRTDGAARRRSARDVGRLVSRGAPDLAYRAQAGLPRRRSIASCRAAMPRVISGRARSRGRSRSRRRSPRVARPAGPPRRMPDVRATAGAAPVAPVPDEPVGFEASPPRPLKRRGKAFVDFQNDVTTDDIALAHEEGLCLGRASEALHDTRDGHRSGQDQQRECRALDGRAARRRIARGGHDDLSAALYAGIDRRARRTAHRRTVPADAPLALARLARRERRRHDRGGTVAASVVLPLGGRQRRFRVRRGNASGARRRRRVRCLDARQDRRPGARCRGVPEPRLCERLRQDCPSARRATGSC